MKKKLSLIMLICLLVSTLGISFADEATYYIGDFNRSKSDLNSRSHNFKIVTEKELSKLQSAKYSSNMMKRSSTGDLNGNVVIGYRTDDGGLVLDATMQNTAAYEEVTSNGYTDLNYSFWGTWSWASDAATDIILAKIDAGASAAQAANEAIRQLAPAVVLSGAAAGPTAAAAILTKVVETHYTVAYADIENCRTNMGVAIKTSITGIAVAKSYGQYVAKLY